MRNIGQTKSTQLTRYNKYFCWRLPDAIVTDNGSQFVLGESNAFRDELNI